MGVAGGRLGQGLGGSAGETADLTLTLTLTLGKGLGGEGERRRTSEETESLRLSGLFGSALVAIG